MTAENNARLRGPTAAVAAVLVLLTVLALAYVRVGWWRMETACTGDPPTARAAATVELGWGWRPPGFTCTFSDGRTRTSLWF